MYFRTLLFTPFLFIVLSTYCSAQLSSPTDDERNRAKLLSYMISKQLSQKHFSHKAINDDLSRQAFDIYIKQLDPQKRFFLQKDIESLRQYELVLDDQMNSGRIEFPLLIERLLQERVATVELMVAEIFKRGFNLEVNDDMQTDPKKLAFCKTEEELRERWRVSLKYQLTSRYLTLLEDEQGKADLRKAELEKDKNLAEDDEPVKSEKEVLADAQEKLQKSSHDLFKRILRGTVQDAYDRYFSIIARAFDPHSDFMPPTQKEDFDIHMRGSLEGIGAVLQEDNGYIKVVRIIPGGAASRQKELHAEDIILMVAQGTDQPVDIIDMRIREAVTLIRGKKGSEVRLTVKKPDGVVKNIKIIRDVVQLEETFVKSAILPDSAGHGVYGYLKIPSFYRDFQNTRRGGNGRNVTDDVLKELKVLQGNNIKGLILDLRNNGGGALVDAVKTAGLFIKNGPIVQVKSSGKKAEALYDYDPEIQYDGPLVVLVNKFSASASEILAGALQDYNRAIIVGADHSYGKGTVQTLFNLDDNMPFMSLNMNQYKPMGALKMTTQKFYRINGESTQNRGVVPDIVLPDRFKYIEAGEQYLENAMAWDTIEPIGFSTWGNSAKFKNIQNVSAQRVISDEDFQEIIKESEEAKKRQEETIVHVNLDNLRKELEKSKELSPKDSFRGHGHGGNFAKKETDDELTDEEEEKKFVEQLQDDPYVEESINLLGDIAS